MDFGEGSAFKFNFGGAEADAPTQDAGGGAAGRDGEGEVAPVPELPAKEVFVDDEDVEGVRVKEVQAGGVTLRKVTVLDATMAGIEEAAGSDLEPGRYEGGLKLWEGSLDLAGYLAGLGDKHCKGKRVLELGCGHALPGVVAGMQGCECLVLQDYNEEVLRVVTAPNVTANLEGCMPAQVRYVAGGWGEMVPLLVPPGYDVVLTAETIYSKASQRALYKLIKETTRRPGGVALVAAKSYYFGVGGGTHTFTQLVDADGEMEVERVAEFRDGGSNVREILQLSWA